MSKPIRTIVVGVGNTHQTDPALLAAAKLAEQTGATLHVVHSFSLPEPVLDAYARMGYLNPDMFDRYSAELQTTLEKQVASIAPGERVHTHTLGGSPAEVLCTFAAEVEADLLIVGASREGRLLRFLLGTTANSLVRSSPVPLLVVRDPNGTLPERVLLTSDLSDFSAAVHEHGMDLVEGMVGDSDVEIRSLLVLAFDIALPPPLPTHVVDEVIIKELEAFLARRRPRSGEIEPTVRIGQAVHEILEEAATWGAQLVVVGTHGRTGLPRLMLGSVAGGVLREAACNVLVIPSSVVNAAGDASAAAAVETPGADAA